MLPDMILHACAAYFKKKGNKFKKRDENLEKLTVLALVDAN